MTDAAPPAGPNAEESAGQAREERRAERQVSALFVLASASAVALAVVYWVGGQPQLEGLFLGLSLTGVACGFVIWGNHLLPKGPFVDSRHAMPSGEAEVDEAEDDIERGGVITRRKMIVRSLGLAVAGLGVAAVFPIRSLGPRPGRALVETPWKKGLRLITEDGRPVRAADIPVGGLLTVFPDGFPGSADGQAVLVRVEPNLLRPQRERATWSPQGLIAYSKICTHAGCPVGLYQAASHQLLCPCHQSTFDVLNHAEPQIGPAAAPLPQLPLDIDADGFVIATGDFSEPVGPSFWHRS
ncbi:MAG TPA: Rieske 2Fe-2S domain-containing protein [Actinomycetota bacterium]|nr:Rieske 2Fe-2S domain-containing protein [Actinomycetota bacterium]